MKLLQKSLLITSFCAIASLLSACQSPIESKPVGSYENYWSTMQEKLAAINTAKLKGRLGIQNPQGRMSAYYNYNLDNDSYTLELISSMGSQIGKLSVDAKGASLIADGRVYRHQNPESLIKDRFGLEIPLSSLKEIMLGIPQGRALKNPEGQYLSAAVSGFVIEYQKFAEFNGYALPSDFTISNEDTLIKVKLNEVLELNS